MMPAPMPILDRAVWLVSFAAMTIATAAVDWRLGLFVAGTLMALASLDLRGRHP